MRKIIHVHLIFEKRDYYFGSIKAIFDHLSAEEIGIKKSTLEHCGMATGVTKITKRAIIKQSTLIVSSERKNDGPSG